MGIIKNDDFFCHRCTDIKKIFVNLGALVSSWRKISLPLRLKDTKQHKGNLVNLSALVSSWQNILPLRHKEKIIKKDDIPFLLISFFCTLVV